MLDRRNIAGQTEHDTADGLLERLAWHVIVAANSDVTRLQRAPVGLVRRLSAIHRRDDDMVEKDPAPGVGAFLALTTITGALGRWASSSSP